MKTILFNVVQIKEQDGKPTRLTILAHNVTFDKATLVYKEYAHRDGYIIGNVFSTVEIEVSEASKKILLEER